MLNIFKNEALIKGITCVMLFVFILGWQPLAGGLAAQSENFESSQKHETIFANLDHSGNIIEMFAVNSFIRPGERVLDYGDYAKITNLTNNSAPVIEDGRIIFEDTGDEAIFRYQGTIDMLDRN